MIFETGCGILRRCRTKNEGRKVLHYAAVEASDGLYCIVVHWIVSCSTLHSAFRSVQAAASTRILIPIVILNVGVWTLPRSMRQLVRFCLELVS